MEIIEKLPDDIIVHIYTKILKKYRLHEGKFIKRIDIEKYNFLEKFISRKIVSVSNKNFGYNRDLTKEIRYKLNNFCELPDRKDLSIDDDMIYIFLTISENKVIYDIYWYKLKKIEDIVKKSKLSIYYKADYKDYDWEVFSYTYEI
jgi:hypothetical protein